MKSVMFTIRGWANLDTPSLKIMTFLLEWKYVNSLEMDSQVCLQFVTLSTSGTLVWSFITM
jgi:hypothetical protein